MTGHTTPGVVSSIVSSEALQADLLHAGENLQRPEEVSEDVLAHENDYGDISEDDHQDREDHHQDREDAHQDRQDDHEDREDLGDDENNELFDSYWPQNFENEPITVSSQDTSQEGVYEIRYGAEDDSEGNPDDHEEDHEEPEVISDSDSEEEHGDTPIDRFIPIHDDSDDPEGNDHPSVEIVEPEGLHIYHEGEYEDVSDEDEHEDEIDEDCDEEQGHPSIWRQGSRRISAPPPRRSSSSSDEVICLDSD